MMIEHAIRNFFDSLSGCGKYKKLLLLPTLFLFTFCCHAKITGLPPYKTIDIPFDEYGSHFDFVIDNDNVVFVASIKGVKVYNGLKWQLIKIADNSNIRRLYYHQNRVYVGGEGIIGYIKKNELGQYKYTDITPKGYQGKFESVWQITQCNNAIYFQDVYDILSFDLTTQKSRYWHFEAKLGSFICNNNHMLLQNRNTGLVKLVNNKWVESDIVLEKNDLIYHMTRIADNEIFILSDNDEWRVIKDNRVEKLKFSKNLPNIVNYVSIAALGNHDFVLGSNNGLLTFVNSQSMHSETFQLDNEWISKIIYRNHKLIVLTEFQIFYLEWPSPFRFYSKESGIASDIHDIQEWNGNSYVLSSSGVFLEDQKQQIYQHKLFKRLNWTNREAWSLLPLSTSHALLAESHKIYQVNYENDEITKPISGIIYPRELYYSKYNSQLIYVITEHDIQLLFHSENSWNFSKIYPTRPKSMLETKKGEILLSFSKSMPILISFNADTGEVISQEKINFETNKAVDKSLLFHETKQNKVLAFSHHVTTYKDKIFSPTDLFGLNNIIKDETLLSLKQDINGHYYGHTSTKLILSNKDKTWEKIDLKPYLKSTITAVQKIGNELKISSHGQIINYISGIEIPKKKNSDNKLNINSIFFTSKSAQSPIRINPNHTFSYEQGQGSINFIFSINDILNHDANQYRYRLKGFDDDWSNYFYDNQIKFNNLAAGHYRFELQGKDINNNTYSCTPYEFDIKPHWYLTTIARLIWLFLSFMILYLIFKKTLKWRESIHIEQKRELKQIIDKKTNALKLANQELTKIAHQDGLTGLSNRLYLDEYIKNIIKDKSQKIIVVMLDMDYFKHYNDKYGHIAGDALLQLLSKHLKNTFNQKNNIVARYGGEEFVVILKETPMKKVLELADKIRKLIENKNKQISVSIGICAANDNQSIETIENVYQLINCADKALYKAKESGRNKIVVF